MVQCKKLAINKRTKIPRKCSAKKGQPLVDETIHSTANKDGIAFRLATPSFYSSK